MEVKVEEIIFEGGTETQDLMEQFLSSGYFTNGQLNIDRFLDLDKTINLEKLELGIVLALENLEKSVKIKNPVYVFIGNMNEYIRIRGLDNEKQLDRIIEESSFILGFCQAIADEESERKVIVRFRGNDV